MAALKPQKRGRKATTRNPSASELTQLQRENDRLAKRVDAETARVYHTASPDDQKKIQLMLQLRLRELAELPRKSPAEIVDDIGAKPEARGLPPGILEVILHDD